MLLSPSSEKHSLVSTPQIPAAASSTEAVTMRLPSTKKDADTKTLVLHITNSSKKDWIQQLLFFSFFYLLIFVLLAWLQKGFAPEAIPWADAFASASAYTGMWLMARKKTESWIWWIATNMASIPLYFVKGYVFTSVQFVILLILAIAGLIEWKKRAV